MSINIPDSIPKLLILIGIIGIAVGVYEEKELTEKYFAKFDKFDEIQDAVTLESYLVKLERKNLLERARQFSRCLNVENPIEEKDSTISFIRVFSGDKKKVILTDSLDKYWNNYLKKQKNLDILLKKKEIQLKNINNEEKVLNFRKEYYGAFFKIGLVFFIFGIVGWIFDNSESSENIRKQNDKIYKYCQSCGFKFSSIRPYGTEKDETKNLAFCIECYKKGKISEPNLSKEEFINRKKNEIKDKSWLTRKILMARFNKLERWNKDKYF